MRQYFLAAMMLIAVPAFAEFQVPALTGPVVDNANLLSPRAEQKIEALVRDFFESSGKQLQVLTVPNMGGLEIEQASIKVVDQWKLGNAKDDNGVLLIIAQQERKVRIEVGQGLEGVLTDMTAGQIVRNVITPHFREGDYDGGVLAGVIAIIERADPQFRGGAPTSIDRGSGGNLQLWILLLFFIVILIQVWIARPSRRRRRGSYYGDPGGFYGGTSGGFGSGSTGGWGSGSGSSWGGGGGGFSGGGASGGW